MVVAVSVMCRLPFGVDDVELLLKGRDARRPITQCSPGPRGIPGHELSEHPGRSAPPVMESVASQPTPKGRSVMVKPDNLSGSQKRLSYWVETFSAAQA